MEHLTSLSISAGWRYSGVSQFIIIDPQPVVLDHEAHDSDEQLRLRLEEARSDALLAWVEREKRLASRARRDTVEA